MLCAISSIVTRTEVHKLVYIIRLIIYFCNHHGSYQFKYHFQRASCIDIRIRNKSRNNLLYFVKEGPWYDFEKRMVYTPICMEGVIELRFSYILAIRKIIYIQGVTGGTDQTSGECSLC